MIKIFKGKQQLCSQCLLTAFSIVTLFYCASFMVQCSRSNASSWQFYATGLCMNNTEKSCNLPPLPPPSPYENRTERRRNWTLLFFMHVLPGLPYFRWQFKETTWHAPTILSGKKCAKSHFGVTEEPACILDVRKRKGVCNCSHTLKSVLVSPPLCTHASVAG